MVKIHGRCNLDCDYCYMYRAADQRWRDEPRTMSGPVIDLTARRIAEHVHIHRLTRIGVVLHGGEPLLAGAAAIERLVRSVREGVGPGVRVDATLQTNGTLLTPGRLDRLAALDIGVGVSLDGGAEAHDRHRRGHDGRGSHAATEAGLRLLTSAPYRALFTGLLCTIDLAADPVATYRELLRHRPPTVDFLLPHGNWSAPPPGRDPARQHDTPYADWLIRIFDRWYGAAERPSGIRLFDDLISLMLGGRGTVEGTGLAPVDYIVVETDGTLTLDDALRAAYPGAGDTGLHLARDPFDAALPLPGLTARRSGAAGLAAECRRCPLVQVCGGGHHVHRYRADGSGFANPSVYCADLQTLIRHIHRRVAGDVARLTRTSRGASAGADAHADTGPGHTGAGSGGADVPSAGAGAGAVGVGVGGLAGGDAASGGTGDRVGGREAGAVGTRTGVA